MPCNGGSTPDGGGGGDWRAAACLAVPFVVLVAGHYLFRYSYYGEWLPNTYYAKHVRPWYEMGLRYLWAAALETGLYLLLPLAVVSLVKGWRKRRCLTYALPLLCVVSHMAYVARIGGDHFEYRLLDFYWPLLSVPAVEGIVVFGAVISERLQKGAGGHWKRGVCAFLLFMPIVFYSNVIQGIQLITRIPLSSSIQGAIDEGSTGWLLGVPGVPVLVASIDDLHKQLDRHANARRASQHAQYATWRLLDNFAYESVDWASFPQDAVTSRTDAGIFPFYAYGLTVIDEYGLNDATIARNPVHPNSHRWIAHDRRPPPGYLEKRGVNIKVYPSVSGERLEATGARYAVKFGRNLWMPFDSPDHQWVIESFDERDLRILIHGADGGGGFQSGAVEATRYRTKFDYERR